MVASYVTQHGGDEDVKDVFQEMLIALVGILRKPEGFHLHSGAKFSTFLHSIASKVWLMRVRSGRAYSSALAKLPPEDESGVEDKQVYETKHELMAKVFEQIGEDCQKLLEAFYYQKKT
ncbi:MAG: sigma-70 family RNA polymerase sigma factor [Saprospiraceae bacterium]|nr:sigma-70 family RNA polymerase sigma factor [Saprospiraceae bacterium]